MRSNDGSRLRIGGKIVSEINGKAGLDPIFAAPSRIALSKGFHSFEIEYFQKFETLLPIIGKNYLMNFFDWKKNDVLLINEYGILEPVKSRIKNPDIILVPLLAFDSKKVKRNYIFFAIKGNKFDGNKYIPEAIKKATDAAKASLIKVPLKEGRTLHHDIEGRHGAGKVILRTAPPGTGIIAGGPMRAVFEVLGIQDVVAKSIGSSNPYNMVRATVKALSKINSPRQVAARRGKKVNEVISQRVNDGEVSA